jgi:HK97 family phage portal protein
MGLIDRLFRRETRRTEPSWAMLSRGLPYHGIATAGAETIAAVSACINYISSNIASLPPLLYGIDAAGRRTENTSHSVNRVLQIPNTAQTWCEFAEWMFGSVLATGNAFATMDHDLSGRLVSLNPVPWGRVVPYIGPSGAPVYEVQQPGRPAMRYLASEALHLKDRGPSPYVGVSRLARAAGTVHHAQSADTAASAAFERSARPSGAFKITGKIGRGEETQFKEMIAAEVTGASKTGKVLVLQEGLEFQPFDAATARDAELLASRAWSVIDIARLYSVPPILIGDWQFARGPVASEAQTLFANTTLRAWVTKFEAMFNASVFGAGTGGRFALALDMSGLQRADPATRIAADNVLLSHAVISKNECRESWGYSPSNAPGMDDFMASPQTGGAQIGGTQPGGMMGAPI